ncbi:MAG: hypothetical protein LUQ36_04045 [Methanoregula sp.]|nr:hypothetical protein [Methanoregula sp.]
MILIFDIAVCLLPLGRVKVGSPFVLSGNIPPYTAIVRTGVIHGEWEA